MYYVIVEFGDCIIGGAASLRPGAIRAGLPGYMAMGAAIDLAAVEAKPAR